MCEDKCCLNNEPQLKRKRVDEDELERNTSLPTKRARVFEETSLQKRYFGDVSAGSRNIADSNERPVTTIWIIGSSYIERVEDTALEKFGENLGLNTRVQWFGKGGIRWSGVLPRFYSELSTQSPPDILVVYAGGNDLGHASAHELASAMQRDLLQLHEAFPLMKIAFSCINERQVWRYGKLWQIIKDRKLINKSIRNAIWRLGGKVIEHPLLRYYEDSLYLPDGVHFTTRGNQLFLSSIRH